MNKDKLYPKKNLKVSMKLPKIEVKYKGTRRSYYINDIKSKLVYSRGMRPKVFLPEYGIVIKFNHYLDYPHDDQYFYKLISRYDKRFFPKLIKQTEEYSIHELVPHKRIRRCDDDLYYQAEELKNKYGFEDFAELQIGKRLDNGKLVYFDYGYVVNGSSCDMGYQYSNFTSWEYESY